MGFSGLTFIFLFLPLLLAVYYVAPKKWRNAVLFAAGLIFCAWGGPWYVLLLLFSTLIAFLLGPAVEKARGTPRAKPLLAVAVAAALLPLLVFKYGDFAVSNLNAVFGGLLTPPGFALPLGLSFYTFKLISYSVDVYRGGVRAERDFLLFGTYVTLFPQLTAGPIARFADTQKQLTGRRESFALFAAGARRFVCGLAKKALLADNIGGVWTRFSAPPSDEASVLGAWLGVLAFAFQLYFDFSGYSDMAVGLGGMFGFTFPENFTHPYASRSVGEFWRRWHITLGGWFRDYVYRPVSGWLIKRKTKMSTIYLLSSLAVWAATGLWHGAAWSFVAWGLYCCLFIVLEQRLIGKPLQKAPAIVARLYTLLVVVVGWAIFAAGSLSGAASCLARMFGFGVVPVNDRALYELGSNWLLLVILAAGCTPLPAKLAGRLLSGERWPVLRAAAANIAMAALFLLTVAYLVDSTYNPFLYAQF